MKAGPAQWLEKIWYQDASAGYWLRPIGRLYRHVAVFRRYLYLNGWLRQRRLPVPVVIVGNITVGGTGKTPLIILLAQRLKTEGFKPGIVSRGYRGSAGDRPQAVTATSSVDRVGDEALLIQRHTGCPMAVSPKRAAAAEWLLNREACDVILSDDGLQHYALARDIEIAVVDGDRQCGNGLCLPAGPLREPPERLNEVDLVVVNGGDGRDGRFPMALEGRIAVNLVSGAERPLREFSGGCHAVAGIGHPGRFFRMLETTGLACINHAFPDHHPFRAEDLEFDEQPVLMTEKDAVKCTAFARPNHWFVPVEAVVDESFIDRFVTLLREKHGQ
ncbi:MAG: tetraacyldisaccharide 4'-kinase [Gammaproteobacteria bacterium]